MSAPSGVKVPSELTSAFSAALSDAGNIRALVFIIEGESFKHLTTVKTKSTFKDDINLLPPILPTPKTPASFAYRLDSKDAGRFEWMMVTFVPDDAGVRAKMLQASSRSGLLKALGANNFKHDWFATSLNDLTPSALSSHLKHLDAPPPLTASEAALAEVRAAEAEEAKRAALDSETAARRAKAIIGLQGKMRWDEGVESALKKVAERSDEGWIVTLEIPSSNPGGLALLTSESCKPSQLASKLPPKSPCYTFYSFPTPPPPASSSPTIRSPVPHSARNTFTGSQGGERPVAAPLYVKPADGEETSESAKEEAENTDKPVAAVPEKPSKGRVLFIYTCPSASPVKFRMVYSSSVRGVQQDAADKAGVEIVAKLETSDISDLTESHLKSSIPSKPSPTHSSSLPTPTGMGFGRPRPTPSSMPIRSATQIPLPASEGPSTPIGGTSSGDAGTDEDTAERVRKAFEAFGPRVGAGGGGGVTGGGFARPRPAGKR